MYLSTYNYLHVPTFIQLGNTSDGHTYKHTCLQHKRTLLVKATLQNYSITANSSLKHFSNSGHSNVTGHYPLWDEVKFIDRVPHWYTRRVEEAIHIRLHPDNINRDNGIEIPEAWMPTIKQHSSRSVPRWTDEGTISSLNDKD